MQVVRGCALAAILMMACGGHPDATGGDAAVATDAPAGALCGNGVVEPGEACDDGTNDHFGGGCLPGCTAMDTSDQAFAPALREIAITMDPALWEAMRHEVKSRHQIFGTGIDCRTHPFESPYNWYPGDVTIDGQPFPSVAIRKKGHLGSQSTLRPSIRLDFDKLVDGDRSYFGLDGFSLDNNKQDPSLARTCTAYALMRAAGLATPRCTHAHVVVNGADQGIYTLHEEVDHGFLQRHFHDAGGTLYEGTANDFRPEFIGFEQESNQSDTSHADLQAVMTALATDDAGVEAALDRVIDLDEFYRFWAAEVLVWHRDGYSGNANNFFIYADGADGGRFSFIPWGVDSALFGNSQATVPDSVMAFSALTQRLYAIPAARARYYAALDDLLAHVWDPDALIAGVDAVGAAADPLLSASDRSGRASAAVTLESVIASRASDIAMARAGGAAWTEPLRALPCRIPSGTAHGTFATTWGSIGQNVFTAGTGALVLDIPNGQVTTTRTGSRAGVSGSQRVQVIGETATRRYTMTVPYPDARWFDPFSVVGDYPLTLPPLTITINETDLATGATLRKFELGDGTWTFTAVSTTSGQSVTGGFTGNLYLIP